MPDTTPAYQAAAASLLKCLPEDLLAFRWAADEEQFIAIAPTGQKYRFDLAQLEAAMKPAKIQDPETKPPAATPSTALAGEGRGRGTPAAADSPTPAGRRGAASRAQTKP